MVDTKPLVSIGMPVYNGERFLNEALDSLLAQDYVNFELIISDNASTDETQEICLKYTARDKRVRYYRSKMNMGAAWNFNRVFELSSGDYFMWASHDDLWDPRYIEVCLEGFKLSDKVILSGTMCRSIFETGELMFIDQGFSTIGLDPASRFKHYKRIIHGGNHIGGIFYGIYKRSALSKVMPAKKLVGNDHVILAGLCFQGEFFTANEVLFVKRFGGASRSHKDNAHVQGISNPFFYKFPYLVREVFLQRIIFQADMLTLSEKVRLACWSLINYVKINFFREIRRRYYLLLSLSHCLYTSVRERLGSATRKMLGPSKSTGD